MSGCHHKRLLRSCEELEEVVEDAVVTVGEDIGDSNAAAAEADARARLRAQRLNKAVKLEEVVALKEEEAAEHQQQGAAMAEAVAAVVVPDLVKQVAARRLAIDDGKLPPRLMPGKRAGPMAGPREHIIE